LDIHDLRSEEDFEPFYKENGLETDEQKIWFLTACMKIRASRGERETPAEILRGLEEQALLGFWKSSQ